MEWGDAIMWRSVLATPGMAEDPEIKERLFHIHFTQFAFYAAWIGQKFERKKAADFASLDEILNWAKSFYPDILSFLGSLEDDQLEGPLPLPWAGYFGRQLGREVAVTTLGETMLQLSNHSIHHRAQLNTQIRAHGGEPPLIDYIVWLWSSRPAAEWI